MNIVAIQIMRRQLGLSDNRYRDLLRLTGGVNSSKDLTDANAKKVYRELCRLSQASTPAARYVWVLWNAALFARKRTQRSLSGGLYTAMLPHRRDRGSDPAFVPQRR